MVARARAKALNRARLPGKPTINSNSWVTGACLLATRLEGIGRRVAVSNNFIVQARYCRINRETLRLERMHDSLEEVIGVWYVERISI
jgi:hypothetical protein